MGQVGRRRFVAAAGALLAVPRTAFAQSAQSLPRVGVLVFAIDIGPFREAFSEGLLRHGYVEGRNIRVDWRSANGRQEQARAIAEEFVRDKVDVIVGSLTPAVLAAQRATRSVPIVMAPAGDPLKQGFATSLAQPGGNITGLTGVELSAKRVELLREFVPNLKRVLLLLSRSDPSYGRVMADSAVPASKALGIPIDLTMVSTTEELDAALAAVARLALRHRLASITHSSVFPESGGLLSYGIDFRHQYRSSADYVARILKGEKPAQMPVQQATNFEMVINRGTAAALGLSLPVALLLRANRLIE